MATRRITFYPAREGLQEQSMSNVDIDLRSEIFNRLQSGPMTTFELASALGQSVKTLATICARMEKDGCLKHTGPRKKYIWFLPANAPPVFHPPLHPQAPLPRLTPFPGVTPDDLEWMAHYRQRAEQRKMRAAS